MEYEALVPFRHFSENIINNSILFCKDYDEEMLIEDELSEIECDKYHYMDDIDEINNKKYIFHHDMCSNDHYKNKEVINIKKFEILCYFKVNKDEFTYSIQSDALNLKTQCVYDLIKNIIKIINESQITFEYNSLKYILSLKDCDDENDIDFYINNYELRPCKIIKNIPNFDLPCYCPNSLLNNMVNEKISFSTKNPLNIILIENYDNYSEKIYKKKIKYINSNKNIENGFNLKKVKSTSNCNIF
jgi:hypothetical protein